MSTVRIEPAFGANFERLAPQFTASMPKVTLPEPLPKPVSHLSMEEEFWRALLYSSSRAFV